MRAVECRQRQTGALRVESREQRAANGESWGGAEGSGAIGGTREIVKLERRVSGERAAAL